MHIGYTSERLHQTIRDNLHQSPLYSGKIKGVGPRYCPSIEDKVVKFAEKIGISFFSNPKDTTRTRSISTVSRPRCRQSCSSNCCE